MNCICAALICVASFVLGAPTSAFAVEVPKMVTIIVPYPVGGLGDIMPRAMGEVLRS